MVNRTVIAFSEDIKGKVSGGNICIIITEIAVLYVDKSNGTDCFEFCTRGLVG